MDYTNQPLGLRVQTQIPLNVKEYKESENALKNLGTNNNLAYTYEKGLIVYCILEGTRYEWKEMSIGETGLLPTNFVYPDNIITFGIDYSNKSYNFVFRPSNSPLEKINEGNGIGIIIRGRNSANYGNIGLNAIDLSYNSTSSVIVGATGLSSFTSGDRTTASGLFSNATCSDSIASGDFSNASNNNTRASGDASHAEGEDTEASGTASHSEGQNSLASGDVSHSQNLNTTASGVASHSEGDQTIASGDASHAEGFQTNAIGKYSHAGGNNNDANSYCETAVGIFGTAPAGNAMSWIGTDRLYNIGNGLNAGVLSNAFTLLKNGLATLPSVTNALITAGSGKSIVTKEFLFANIDGSETKIINGTNTTVTGNGTVATPYNINVVTKVKNIGYFTGFDVASSAGSLTVGGDITLAVATVIIIDSVVEVTLANAMDNLNYYVRTFIESLSTNTNDDDDICTPVFKKISTTKFSLTFREMESIVQNLKIHVEVVQI